MRYYVHSESVANLPVCWVEYSSKEEAEKVAIAASSTRLAIEKGRTHIVSVVASDGVVVDQYIPWRLTH